MLVLGKRIKLMSVKDKNFRLGLSWDYVTLGTGVLVRQLY